MGARTVRVVIWLARIGVAGLLVRMGLSMLGWMSRPAPGTILVAAAAAAAAAVPAVRWNTDELRVAGVVAVVAAGASASVSGLGASETAVVLVGVAVLLFADRFETPRRLPWSRVLAVVGIVLVTVALVRIATVDRILGHDEAAYALRARAWVADTPLTGFRVTRPVGLPILITPLVAVTQDEQTLRLVGVVFAVAAVILVGVLARWLAGPWAAWTAAGTTVAAVEFMRRGAELLTDVPSAALLLGVVAVAWRHFERREKPGWGLAALAPLAAGAFYLRYQSVLALAGVAVAAAVLWRRRLASPPVAVTVAVTVGLLVPHLVYAQAVTGSPVGLLLPSAAHTVRDYLGQGFVDYARMFPVGLFGPAGALLMVAAAVGGLRRLLRRDGGPLARFETLAFLTVLTVVVPVGVVSQGEPRFVFFPVLLLVVGGAAEIVVFLLGRSGRWRTVLVWGLSVLLAGLVATTTSRLVRSRHVLAEQGQVLAEAAATIVADAAGRTCGVLTSTEPQITWYTGCATAGFGDVPRAGAERRLSGDVRYLLLYDGGKRQPEGDLLDDYLALTDGPPVVVSDRSGRAGDAYLYRLASSS